MNQFQQLVVDTVRGTAGDALERTELFRDELTLFVEQSKLLDVVRMLRDDASMRFVMLEDIVADDFLNDYPRFHVSYMLYSIENKHRVRVRVEVEDPDEGPATLVPLYNVATWLEMEVYDLMGIRFQGNDNLRRLFLPEDWQGHPLRKDYPLGYEEVQFSFNWREIDAKKPYAED